MGHKLDISIQIMNDKALIDMAGSIDEDVDFSKLSSIKSPGFHFNFEKVSMINSCGIREWIKFMDSLGSMANIKYLNCPQIIIEQMNMVYGFVRKGVTVESFYAPYYCEKCDIEVKVLIKTKDVIGKKAPIMKHEDHEMEFDAIEEQYFNFISQIK